MVAPAASSPTAETIRDGSYAPLSRPLYVYANRASLDRPEVAEFLRFYLSDAAAYAEQVGLVASAEDVYAANRTKSGGGDHCDRDPVRLAPAPNSVLSGSLVTREHDPTFRCRMRAIHPALT